MRTRRTGSPRLSPRFPAMVVLLITAMATGAAALEVVLSADRERVVVGQQFTVVVEVRGEGVKKLPGPELPASPGVEIASRYESRNFSYINGSMTASLTTRFLMVPTKAGRIVLGPATAARGDEVFRSNTITVEAVRPGSSASASPKLGDERPPSSSGRDLIVTARAEPETPFVNQQGTYTLTFLRRVRLLGTPHYAQPGFEGFWAEELDSSQATEVLLEGQRYIAERVRVALFPTGDGEYGIAPATLNATLEDRYRSRRDLFGFMRGGRSVQLATDSITVHVQPLPAAGKPEEFSGAVGQFQLAATLDRDTVAAGEPVTLSVRLAGEGNVKVIPAPALPEMPGFKVYESSSTERSHAEDGVIRGEKVWEFILVPSVGGVSEFPPVTLDTFEPASGRYVRLETAVLPLTVEAPGGVPTEGGVVHSGKERVLLRDRDIRYLKPHPGSFGGQAGLPLPLAGMLLAYGLPALAVAGSAGLRRHRDKIRTDVRYARNRRARRVASRRFRAADGTLSENRLEDFYGEVSAALRGYAADRLHLAATSLDEATVRQAWGGDDEAARASSDLFEMLMLCDSARYSGRGSDPGAAREMLTRAKAWVERMEKR
ncbi:MAG: hypothetical protein CME07_03370 [Gemmatimonadetes bacterium]|nr:hypothetical protein [Gemmatimonadota bacterium]